MTGLEMYAVLKFWLPIVTAGGFVVKAYLSAKKSIGTWANTLLDNHMSHIQEASEKSSAAIIELADYHKQMLGTQEKMIISMERISEDFRDHIRDDERVQGSILLSLKAIEIRQEHILDQTRNRHAAASVDATDFSNIEACPAIPVGPDIPKVG